MKIANYQAFALSTAIYRELPGGDSPSYPAMGLAGETGEVCEKLADGTLGEELAKELGDVLWYIANLSKDMGESLSCLAEAEDFSSLQAALPGSGATSDAALRLAGKAGKVCEITKKLIRDDGNRLTDRRRVAILSALSETLVAFCRLIDSLGLDLDAVAEANADKLRSRQRRGQIKGDGDNR